MSTPGGEVVKFEFDPTVPAANFTSAQTVTRLVPRFEIAATEYLRLGDTVQVLQAVPDDPSNPSWSHLLMPAGTVFEYVGPPVAGPSVNLGVGTQHYRDPTLWKVTSEPWGYIDYANDRISVFNLDNEVGNWVVVGEDTVDYSPRRGLSIGGLAPGTYYIVALSD